MEKISYSSITTFRSCPRKYYYSYVERLEEEFAEPLVLGDIFHRLVAAYYKEDEEALNEAHDDYKKLVATGKIDRDLDLMEYLLDLYVGYYKEDDMEEKILGVEKEYLIDWDKGTKFHAIIDKIVERDRLIKLRDTKTTSKTLKYSHTDVQYNVQLNTYAAVVEEEEKIKVDSLEIDEVRLAKLEPVPINKNTKPSTDKRKLGLVTYEAYLSVLEDKGLDTAPEYQSTLDYLKTRGHPLFKRVHVLKDDQLVSSTISDIYSTFRIIEALEKSPTLVYPRTTSFMCDRCQFQALCHLDHFEPTEREREMVWSKNLRKKEDEDLDI